MNWCKFGIHDWTTLLPTEDVDAKVKDYLISEKGFVFNLNRSNGPNRFRKTIYHPNDPSLCENVDLREYYFSSDGNSIENCKGSVYIKVCDRCGKFKQSYTMDKIYQRIDKAIEEETKIARRLLNARYIESMQRNKNETSN